MRHFLTTGALFIFLFSQTVSAQQQLLDSIALLTDSLNSFKIVLSGTNADIEANLPQVEASLNKAADSLETIANFTVTLQKNQNPIVFASIGVLATGIAIGMLSATFLCSCNPKHNLFYRGFRALRTWRDQRAQL